MRPPVYFLIYEPGAGEIKRQVPCDLKVGSKEWTEPSGMLYSYQSHTQGPGEFKLDFSFSHFNLNSSLGGDSLFSDTG